MQTESIIDFALRKLAADSRPTVQIASESGVKPRWLQNLRNGEVPKPGAHLIDRLAHYYGFYSQHHELRPDVFDAPAAEERVPV